MGYIGLNRARLEPSSETTRSRASALACTWGPA